MRSVLSKTNKWGRPRKWPESWSATDLQRFKKFNITPEEMAARVAKQGGCAICKTTAPRGKNSWHVDHSHSTGVVRGILCITCNIAVGMMHDSPERCRSAADYLELGELL